MILVILWKHAGPKNEFLPGVFPGKAGYITIVVPMTGAKVVVASVKRLD
jgi:hypothetical protein